MTRIDALGLRRRCARRHLLAPACAALALGACSYSYVDGTGARRIVGLVDIRIPAAADARPVAGDVVELTTVGLALSRTQQGGSFVLGYSREASTVLRDDALVLGDAAQREAAVQKITTLIGRKRGGHED